MSSAVTFRINGERVEAPAGELDLPLVDFLQEDRGLTGTKLCCGIGVCRACTVAVRRDADAPLHVMLSCSTPLSQLDGASIYTVEGLARDGALHPAQRAFLERFAFQCGYCTPGFLMATVALMDRLARTPVAAAGLDEAIEKALGQHICRCTGYVRYYQAVREVILQTPGLVT